MLSTVRSGSGPLAGLRVIDAGNMIAGPLSATLLGDYGADVIKIEHPSEPDPLREWEPMRDGVSLWWKVTSRNKRTITLDLSDWRGQQILLRLVETADVLIENFRAGTFERWNLDYDTLAGRNPSLVFLRVSGFGQTGVYRERPGYGTIAEALSGIPYFTGQPDGPPTLPGFPMADSTAAVFGALSVMAAIYHRDHSENGLGQEIDLALYEALFRIVESQVIGYDQLGKIKQRVGSRLEEDAPRNAYHTSDDGWIAISASSNRTWERLANAIGRPDLAGDPRFSSSAARVENVEELDEILSHWFASRSTGDAMEHMEAFDVVAAPILNIADIFDHELYRSRENIVTVPDDDFGAVKMPAPVPRFSGTPAKIDFAGRGHGEDSRSVLANDLGLSQREIDELIADGVV